MKDDFIGNRRVA